MQHHAQSDDVVAEGERGLAKEIEISQRHASLQPQAADVRLGRGVDGREVIAGGGEVGVSLQ